MSDANNHEDVTRLFAAERAPMVHLATLLVGSPAADLEYLNLADNQFSGAIPPELGNLTGLDLLDLSGNQLSGPTPETVSELPWDYVGDHTFERDWWRDLHLHCLWPFLGP